MNLKTYADIDIYIDIYIYISIYIYITVSEDRAAELDSRIPSNECPALQNWALLDGCTVFGASTVFVESTVPGYIPNTHVDGAVQAAARPGRELFWTHRHNPLVESPCGSSASNLKGWRTPMTSKGWERYGVKGRTSKGRHNDWMSRLCRLCRPQLHNIIEDHNTRPISTLVR